MSLPKMTSEKSLSSQTNYNVSLSMLKSKIGIISASPPGRICTITITEINGETFRDNNCGSHCDSSIYCWDDLVEVSPYDGVVRVMQCGSFCEDWRHGGR